MHQFIDTPKNQKNGTPGCLDWKSGALFWGVGGHCSAYHMMNRQAKARKSSRPEGGLGGWWWWNPNGSCGEPWNHRGAWVWFWTKASCSFYVFFFCKKNRLVIQQNLGIYTFLKFFFRSWMIFPIASCSFFGNLRFRIPVSMLDFAIFKRVYALDDRLNFKYHRSQLKLNVIQHQIWDFSSFQHLTSHILIHWDLARFPRKLHPRGDVFPLCQLATRASQVKTIQSLRSAVGFPDATWWVGPGDIKWAMKTALVV